MIRLKMLLCLLVVLSLSSVAHAEYASPEIQDGVFVGSLLQSKGVSATSLNNFSDFNGLYVNVALIGGRTAWGQDTAGLLSGSNPTLPITVEQAAANGWYAEARNVAFNSLYFKSESPFNGADESFALNDGNLGMKGDGQNRALVAFRLNNTFSYNGRDYAAGTVLVCFEDMVGYPNADYDYNDMIVAITPTPIPAAAWLLGSGLAGLMALRRRNK